MLLCQECGQEFEPKDKSPSHLRRNPPRYCSRGCGRKWRKNGEQVPCTQCGTSVYRRKSHLALTVLPFCGSSCYGKWQKSHQKETRTDLAEWRRQRPLALERDCHQCQDCGEDQKRLVVHHIQERAPRQPDNHALDNLVTLCDSCHRRRHR